MSGNGCKKCANENRRNKDFLIKCKLKFKNKYDYSIVNFNSLKNKVNIICPEHGVFEQVIADHFNSNGCPFCSGKKMNTEFFIKKSNILHNNYYDYSMLEYKRAFDKVSIICPNHGEFKQMAYTHLAGSGCPVCKSSKGEIKIISLLDNLGIKYETEYTFENCKFKLKLPFDFYLPDSNICIEYNGIQHYKPIEYFGGEKGFEIRKIRDGIKKEYCKKNNIKLKIITYKNDIEEKINEILNEKN